MILNDKAYCADLGNGFYQNPIVSGGLGDSSVLKDGDDYFLVMSGGGARGSLLYHSRDLVNWNPLYYLVTEYEQGLWAPELTKVGDTYYYYNFYCTESPHWNHGDLVVSWTKDIWAGNWTKPEILRANIPAIDPGHVIGEDGKRYLFLSQNMMIPLTDDGLKAAGPYQIVYPDWPIPDDYDVEGQCTESPKLTWHDGWLYLTTAQGGTFGPPTAHMVTSLRARSVFGPWELSPYNPIRHTFSTEEKWAQRGHGTLVEGPGGQWYLVYQGFEMESRMTTGKATLLEPIEWTEDGWWRVCPEVNDWDPIPMPQGGEPVAHEEHLSTDFSGGRLPIYWQPTQLGMDARMSWSDRGLTINGKGIGIRASNPIYLKREHRDLEIICELTADWHAAAGICFGQGGHACGIVVERDRLYAYNDDVAHWDVREHYHKNEAANWSGNHIFLKLINKRDVVSPWYSYDGETWHKINICFDTSRYGESDVWPGIFCAKDGEATFHHFWYNGLDK